MKYLGPVHFRYAPGALSSPALESTARVFLAQLEKVYPRVSTKGMFRNGRNWSMRVMFAAGNPIVDIYTSEEGVLEEEVLMEPLGLAFVMTPHTGPGTYAHDDPWHEYIIKFKSDTGEKQIKEYAEYKGIYWFLDERPVSYNVTWDNGIDTCSWTGARYSASFFEPYSLRTGNFSINGVTVSHSVPSPQVILGAGILHATIDSSSKTPAGKFVCRLATGKFIPSPSTGVVNFAVGINVYDIYISIRDGIASEYQSPTLVYTFEYPNNTIDNGLSKLRGWAFDRTATKCVTIVEYGKDLFQHEIDLSDEENIRVMTIEYGTVGNSVSQSTSAETFDGRMIKDEEGFIKPNSSGSSSGSSVITSTQSPLPEWLPIAADYDCRTNELTVAYFWSGGSGSISWIDGGGGGTPTGMEQHGENAGNKIKIGNFIFSFGGGTITNIIYPFETLETYTGYRYARGHGGGVICDFDIRYKSILLFGGSGALVADYSFSFGVPFSNTVLSSVLCVKIVSDGDTTVYNGEPPVEITSTITFGDDFYIALYDAIPDELQNGSSFIPVSTSTAMIDTLYPNAHDASRGVHTHYTYIDGLDYAYGLASFLDIKKDKVHTLGCTFINFTTPLSGLDGEDITSEIAPSPRNPIFPLGVV